MTNKTHIIPIKKAYEGEVLTFVSPEQRASEAKQQNENNRKTADYYFSQAPTPLNLAKGAYYFLQSHQSEDPNRYKYSTGNVPVAIGVGRAMPLISRVISKYGGDVAKALGLTAGTIAVGSGISRSRSIPVYLAQEAPADSSAVQSAPSDSSAVSVGSQQNTEQGNSQEPSQENPKPEKPKNRYQRLKEAWKDPNKTSDKTKDKITSVQDTPKESFSKRHPKIARTGKVVGGIETADLARVVITNSVDPTANAQLLPVMAINHIYKALLTPENRRLFELKGEKKRQETLQEVEQLERAIQQQRNQRTSQPSFNSRYTTNQEDSMLDASQIQFNILR